MIQLQILKIYKINKMLIMVIFKMIMKMKIMNLRKLIQLLILKVFNKNKMLIMKKHKMMMMILKSLMNLEPED